jgi:hypothetical protein
MSLRSFIDGYVETMLWAETDIDEDGNDHGPLDDNYGPEDIAPESRREIENDCKDFYDANHDLWEDDHEAGGDFYLTRNGHGAGFWDGDYEDGEELTSAAKVYGTQGLQASGDGRLYTHG